MRPFGLEPQRVLRLEKMHVIIGQDTNAESNPLEAAMPWIVKLDKESDWIGRYSIEYLNRRGNRDALVGFVGDNGKMPVEGSQVIGADGDPAGRITSSRFSHRLGQAIGIAWVPVASSEEGTRIDDLRPDRRQDPGRRHAQGLLRPGWREVALMSDSFAFLSPAAVRATDGHRPLLRTPVERSHIAAGATIEVAGGWRIALYDAEPSEAWLADVSHTGKLDVRGDAARVDELTGGADLGAASHHDGVWTLRISPTHAAVICPFERVDRPQRADRRAASPT